MKPLGDLAKPFPPSDIEWRIGQAGMKGDKVWAKVLAYITNRAIMDRLDSVCGPENWRNEFRYEAAGAVLCGLSIKWGDEWVTKWDGAENTDIEAVKGGLSNAMKRAGVQWGIGRYLYDLEEGWATVSESGTHYVPKNEKKGTPAFRWTPPTLPKWALPEPEMSAGGEASPHLSVQATPAGGGASDRATVPVPRGGEPELKRGKLTQKNVNVLLAKVENANTLSECVTRALGGIIIERISDAKQWPEITASDYDAITREIALTKMPPAAVELDAQAASSELFPDGLKDAAQLRRAIMDASNKRMMSAATLKGIVEINTGNAESFASKVDDIPTLNKILKAVESWS